MKPIETLEIISNFDAAENYASDYLRTYFMGYPTPDDQALISFLVDRYKLLKNYPLLLEIGCGPVIDHVLPAVPYVSEIHLADYRADSIQEIQKWKNNLPNAHNWNIFTRYTLELEGISTPTHLQILERENSLRALISECFSCDLRQTQPLGFAASYPAVACFYTTEQASTTLVEWHSVMKNLTSLVAPGGDLLMCAMGECDHYILYDQDAKSKKFPVPKLSIKDFQEALTSAGFAQGDIFIQFEKLEGQEAEGVFAVILVHAKNRQTPLKVQ